MTTQEQLNRLGDGFICASAIILKNDSILIGLRNYTKDKWKEISVWTLPGGRSDKGETIHTTLTREVYEETGINDLQISDHICEVPGVKDGDTVLIFLAKSNQEAKLMEPEKFSEWRWISISDYIANDDYVGFNKPAKDKTVEYLRNLI